MKSSFEIGSIHCKLMHSLMSVGCGTIQRVLLCAVAAVTAVAAGVVAVVALGTVFGRSFLLLSMQSHDGCFFTITGGTYVTMKRDGFVLHGRPCFPVSSFVGGFGRCFKFRLPQR